MKKRLIISLVVLIAILLSSVTAFAASEDSAPSFISYAYDLNNEPYPIPTPFAYLETIDGNSLNVGSFKDLSDIFYSKEENIYVVTDSGNNRFIVLDEDYSVIKVIDSFKNGNTVETFSSPKSAIVANGKIYIADSLNQRIVILNAKSFELENIVAKPAIKALGEYTFTPQRLSVDDSGHIYVVALNITDGIVLLDSDGTFMSFLGAPKVKVSSYQQLIKRFMTEEQRSKLYKSIPTEYNSVSLSSDGYLLVTTQSTQVAAISQINYKGENIFEKRQNIPKGDEVYLSIASTFVDIAEDEEGNILALDSNRGRIFYYAYDGTLLGCFAGKGSLRDNFLSTSSIEVSGDKVFVTDLVLNNITVYKATEFGKNISGAISLLENGKYDEAKPYFEKIIEDCPNYLPAHLNLGRIAYKNGEYSEAAKAFKYVKNLEYYSVVYKEIRQEFLDSNFYLWIAIAAVAIILIIIYMILKKKGRIKNPFKDSQWYKDWKYVNYCNFHPFDGFWCVRRENRGNLSVANTLLVLFSVFSIIRNQWSGFLFKNDSDSIVMLLSTLIPILLWVVINWAISTLFDGKARIKDLYIVTCYALKPYIIASLVLFPLTHFLTADEAFIYTILDAFVWIWMLGLMFFGMLTTQDFLLFKGILATIATFVGIALVIFICLVVLNVSQDMFSYFKELISEIQYRFI